MNPTDLESLREIFRDPRTHIGIGQIKRTELAQDLSVLRALVTILGQNRDVIARVTWGAVGGSAGFFQFPQAGDLVLVAFAEGDDEQAFIFTRLSSKEDTIPPQATNGDTVVRSILGSRAHLLSDQEILLGRGSGLDPSERIPLGDTLALTLSSILSTLATVCGALATHTHHESGAGTTLAPGNASAFTTAQSDLTTLKASPIDDGLMLSDLAKTEK